MMPEPENLTLLSDALTINKGGNGLLVMKGAVGGGSESEEPKKQLESKITDQADLACIQAGFCQLPTPLRKIPY